MNKEFRVRGTVSFLIAVLQAALSPGAARAIPPPPAYEELTLQTMKQLGFEYQVGRNGDFSTIEIRFPRQVRGRLHPHSIRAVTKDRTGRPLQESTSWTSPENRAIVYRFDHRRVDIAISMAFCEPPAASCVEFGIKSATRFVRQTERDSSNHSNHP